MICGQVEAQSLRPANVPDKHEPLRMLVDYGDAPQKRRASHGGMMEAVGLPISQEVQVTLEFLRTRAGDSVLIRSLDGGQVAPQEPVVIPTDGRVVFSFRPGSTTGLYRLAVISAQRYELQFYAFDPDAPVNRPRP